MIPRPDGSFSLPASTTHQRMTVGSTGLAERAPTPRQRTTGRASRSNQANDAGALLLSPSAASTPSAPGDRNSSVSPPQSLRAASSPARTTSRFSPRRASASAGADADSPREPTQAAAEARISALRSVRPCSARSRTRG